MFDNPSSDRIPLSAEVRLAIFLLAVVGLLFLFAKNFPVIAPTLVEGPMISLKEISRGDTSKKQIILTFDGGSEDVSGTKILDVLSRHGVRTSFFLTGRFMEKNQELVRRMNREGHEIYNHSFNHPHLTQISDAEIIAELNKTEEMLQRVAGISSKPYFRPPYGDRDVRVLKTAFGQGYQSVFWTYDALDWQQSDGMTGDQVFRFVISTLAPGNIYLMHIGDNITGDILDNLLNRIEKEGYKVVSLKQGL